MCYAAVDPCVSTDNTNRRKQYNNIHGLDKQNHTIFWQQKRIRPMREWPFLQNIKLILYMYLQIDQW